MISDGKNHFRIQMWTHPVSNSRRRVKMIAKGYPIAMEVAGDTAIWTRPDTGDAPCSYPAPTYSAVRALFEGVLLIPTTVVIPKRVEICKPLQYHSYTTNYGGPMRKPEHIRNGDNYQLHATVLTDVCYRLYADVIAAPDKTGLSLKSLQWDMTTTSPGHAYQDIFNRRLMSGQSFANLCMGWSEFTLSYFGPFREGTKPCQDIPDIRLPSMLREVFPDGYGKGLRISYDTDICIHGGVLEYPRKNVLDLKNLAKSA